MKKKVIAAVVLCAALLLAGGGAVYLNAAEGKKRNLSENQRYAYAYVTAIEGNEVSYLEVEESVVTAALEAEEKDTRSGSDETVSSGGETDIEKPDSNQTETKIPSGGDTENEKPDMSQMPSDGVSSPKISAEDEIFKVETTLIPVGATVHTTSDTKTTFSRLVSGDLLKLLLETDADGNEVIVEIWMVR